MKVINVLAVIGLWAILGILIASMWVVKLGDHNVNNPLLATALLPVMGVVYAAVGISLVLVGVVMMSPILLAVWVLTR